MNNFYQFLAEHDIAYERYDHPPVATCEEARALVPSNDGTDTKNLFVRDKKGKRHILVVVGYDRVVDLKALSDVLGARNLTFASPDRLSRYLGVDPGSVTMLGLVNDTERDVELVVDRALWNAPKFACHPLVNTSTIVLTRGAIERFLAATGHSPRVMDVPGPRLCAHSGL